MPRSVGQRRRESRVAAAVGLAAAVLTAMPASAEDGSKLQLGGFMTRAGGSPAFAVGSSGNPEDLGMIEIGAGSSTAYPTRFAPSSVGPPLDSGWIDDFMLSDGAAGASPALSDSPLPSNPDRGAEQEAVSYFTPRFSGLQFGATYTPPRPTAGANAEAALRSGQDSGPGSDIALGVNYLDSFWGVDVALTGGYRSAALPGAGTLDIELSDEDASLQRYSVGTSIGFSGLRLGGSFARDLGDGPVSVQSWDAGVSYASGPWTIGVDYLRSAFIDTRGPGTDDEELHAVQAGLTYSVGPGIVASFNVLHSSREDREGNANSGTLGILGFSYNF